jgi:hypothetical protein
MGAGDMALFFAALDAEGRAEMEGRRAAEAGAWAAERARLDADERMVAGYVGAVDGVIAEAMQRAGYYRAKSRRLEWVRRRS